MQCFYCISAQGGELVAVIGPLPNKYFIFLSFYKKLKELLNSFLNFSDVSIFLTVLCC
jgi:hypothetical protein